MSGDDKLIFTGLVTAARGNGMFLVEINETKEPTEIQCTLSGKIRKNNIRILEGDKVEVEVSVYDVSKGRITYRIKK